MNKEKIIFHGCARLAEARSALYGTQEAAAEAFGVTRVTWGKYERGEAVPKGDVLQALALRGVDVTYILTGQRTGTLPPMPTHQPASAQLSPRQAALLDNYAHTNEQGKRIIEAAAFAASKQNTKRKAA